MNGCAFQKRILNKLALSAVLGGVSLSALAVGPGFYMGLMMGPATNTGSNVQAQLAGSATTTTITPKSTQFGSRVYMGYKMNQYAGMEGGLTYFSGVQYDSGTANLCSGSTVRVRDFDLLGRGSFTFGNGFEVFGKAGMAATYLTTPSAMNPNLGAACGQSNYSTRIKPTIAAGASYDLSQNWVADVSWNRLMVGNPVNNMDLYAIGISYHFVDVYCGQFLCA